jgi:cation:H+ antiporter
LGAILIIKLSARKAELMSYFQVLGGLVLLVLAGNLLVRGSISVARQFRISPLIIGLTIVAFGTSAPELVVGIDSVLLGFPALALGNVVGSNIANVWLVVGLSVIISPMVLSSTKMMKNLMIMLGVTVLFLGMALSGPFNYFNGLILLSILILFLYTSTNKSLTSNNKSELDTISKYETALADIEGIPEKPDNFVISTLLVIGGFIGLFLGGQIIVEGAVSVARELGVSEAVIGLTIIAIGTSIPELVTAIIASLKGHCELAIGNVIGSNIFNLLGVIGISSLFGEIEVPINFQETDLWIMLVASLTLLPFILMKYRIGRRTGVMFCSFYALYIFSVEHNATNKQIISASLDMST